MMIPIIIAFLKENKDVIMWKTTGESYTGDQLAQFIEDNDPIALQYITDIFEISMDLLRRKVVSSK